MNINIASDTREAFRDWLRDQLKARDFWNRRGDHYLIREFHRWCAAQGVEIDEASLGRYLREENPVIPTPDRCRALATVFNMRAFDVMKAAGLVIDADLEEPQG